MTSAPGECPLRSELLHAELSMAVDRIDGGIGSQDAGGKLPWGSLIYGVFSPVEANKYEKPVFQSQDTR